MVDVDYQTSKGDLVGLMPNLKTTLTARQRRFHAPATKVVSSCFGVGESEGNRNGRIKRHRLVLELQF